MGAKRLNYIYRFKNVINGKCYIGKSYQPEVRREQHISDAKNGSDGLFCRALRKYGEESFSFEILDQTESDEDINEMERRYIIENNSCVLDADTGYNCTRGGDGFTSEETTRYLNERTARGENPFSRGTPFYEKNVTKIKEKVANGAHHFQTDIHRAISKATQERRLASGNHRFLDSKKQSQMQQGRIVDGTFHMHQDEMKEHMRQKSLREVSEGTHNFIRVSICPHCNKEGKGPMMKRWHFDNCKLK